MTEATDCSLPLPHRDIAKPTPVPALAYPLGAQAPTTLAQLTTTRIGGPIASYLEAHSEQLRQLRYPMRGSGVHRHRRHESR